MEQGGFREEGRRYSVIVRYSTIGAAALEAGDGLVAVVWKKKFRGSQKQAGRTDWSKSTVLEVATRSMEQGEDVWECGDGDVTLSIAVRYCSSTPDHSN